MATAIWTQSLRGVRAQRGTFRVREILAIDSGSRDRTLAILESHAVRVIRIPPQEFGHGKTRNLAAAQAQGDYLVFLTQDADSRQHELAGRPADAPASRPVHCRGVQPPPPPAALPPHGMATHR